MTSQYENLNTRDAYNQLLVNLRKRNRNIVLVEADLMEAAGTGKFSEIFPDSSFQVGIAEQNLIGVAAGLSTVGKIPFVNSYASFLSRRACDQIAVSVAFPEFNVKMIGIYAGLTTEHLGPSHHSINDIAIMRSMPNMVIFSPSNYSELKSILEFSVKYKGPVYIRLGFVDKSNFNLQSNKFSFGKGVVVKKGKDITIISTGVMLDKAYQAALALEKRKSISARVINIHTLKPLDKGIIIRAARETKLLLTLEDHNIIGGLGSAVAEIVSGKGFTSKLIRMGLENTFSKSGSFDWLIKKHKLDVTDIAKTIEKNYVKN